jgi:hypothetical protein
VLATETNQNWEDIRDAHLTVAADSGNAGVTIVDIPTSDSVHLTPAGSATAGQRIALAIAAMFGAATASNGPRITTASIVSNVITVTLAHSGGTDFTPSSGITGFRVLANGVPATISSAVRSSPTTVTLTLAATPASPVLVQYGYGAAPTMTAPLVDNSPLLLPLQTTLADVTVGAESSALSITLTTDGTAPAASLAGMKWAIFSQTNPSAFTAPIAKGSVASTDGSGVLVISLAGLGVAPGSVVWLLVTDSDGTTTQTPAAKAFSGPVVVA